MDHQPVAAVLNLFIDSNKHYIQYTTSRKSGDFVRDGRLDEAANRWSFIEAAPWQATMKVMLGFKEGLWHVTWGERHTPNEQNQAKFVSSALTTEFTSPNMFTACDRFLEVYKAISLLK